PGGCQEGKGRAGRPGGRRGEERESSTTSSRRPPPRRRSSRGTATRRNATPLRGSGGRQAEARQRPLIRSASRRPAMTSSLLCLKPISYVIVVELAGHYSTIRSARCRTVGGIIRPRVLAVFTLMTSAYLVG